MRRALLVLAFGLFMNLAGVFVQTVSAAEAGSETRSRLGEVLHNRKYEEDRRISDIELKAQAGSLSRYSLKADLNYAGPPVNELHNPYMPNPDNRPRPNRTNLSGFIGVRYRLNSNSALNASTGLRWYSPYQEVTGVRVEKASGDTNYSVANPQLAYDRTYLLGKVQGRSSFKSSVTTERYYRDLGQTGSIGLDQAMKYNVGSSRSILGFMVGSDLYFFNRSYRSEDRNISNYGLSFIPSYEYKITDRLNFKTSAALTYTNQRRHANWWIWESQLISQRIGVGWAITRDIYLNPYLNFFLDRPAINTTSLSLGTVLSIF